MSKTHLRSATLFTPGRASYIDQDGILQLTTAAERRAEVASEAYDPNFHDTAVFAGGFPGLAQGWDERLTRPTRREAHLLALPLAKKLKAQGLSDAEISRVVLIQGDSSNSFGDVIVSIERGLLEPKKFRNDPAYGITLVAGALHGRRFKMILSRTLNIDSSRIQRIHMRDIYGTPEYPHQSRERASLAIAKELTAIVLTIVVLRRVRPGNLNDLKRAEQRLITLVSKIRRSRLPVPL